MVTTRQRWLLTAVAAAALLAWLGWLAYLVLTANRYVGQ